ncbi:spore coat U domain-containing protein [Enterobacter cloacae]|uniref:Spore coat U domain-containing protein n=1 Tax=Enterobacter cloacae TaxID=550 RepID=A0A377LYB4_ENTCL|nr:spore coat U domain-containing protein [Enterobacter cloacae]
MKTAFSGLRHCAEGIVHLFFTLILGLALVPAAMAVTSQSFKVSATIVPGCAVSTGSGGC